MIMDWLLKLDNKKITWNCNFISINEYCRISGYNMKVDNEIKICTAGFLILKQISIS